MGLPAIKIAISRYSDVFAGHYVTKALPPHSQASRDLLILYKNMGKHKMATRLWDWMVHQDDRYVSIKTYAGAIHLAAAGNQSLRVCEKLYEEALIRYSDKLGSLILSPGFMLPPQINNWKDVAFEQHLCLAIFHARIRKGDWRTAYVNLDTAFRLWPSAIHCQFLKDLLKGRPVHEGYQVYSLFCQAGAYVGGQELQILLDNMARACEDTVNLLLKSELPKAMLEAVTDFVKIEHARLDARHLDCLIRVFLSVLPRRDLGRGQKDNKLDIAVSSFLSYLKEWFLKRGAKLSGSILTTVISRGRILRVKSLFAWASNEFGNLDQPPDGLLQSCLLLAAREFRSPGTVKVAWESLARRLGITRHGPRPSDWRNFAAAARSTGLVPYYNLQLDLFLSKGKTGAHIARNTDYASRVRPNYPAYQAIHAGNPDIRIAIEAFVQGARAILGDVNSATSKGTNDISPVRFSIWCWPATVPEEWQRRLYDELSSKSGVDLSAVSVLYRPGKAPKSFGISYRELRYRSWKTINNLLLQAEAFEIRNERFIDSEHLSGDSHPIAGAQISKKEDGSSRPHHLP